MKHLLVFPIIVLLLFSSTPAEAGLFSVIKKILKGVAHEIDEHPVLFLEFGVKTKKKILEKKRDRDEEEKGKEENETSLSSRAKCG